MWFRLHVFGTSQSRTRSELNLYLFLFYNCSKSSPKLHKDKFNWVIHLVNDSLWGGEKSASQSVIWNESCVLMIDNILPWHNLLYIITESSQTPTNFVDLLYLVIIAKDTKYYNRYYWLYMFYIDYCKFTTQYSSSKHAHTHTHARARCTSEILVYCTKSYIFFCGKTASYN